MQGNVPPVDPTSHPDWKNPDVPSEQIQADLEGNVPEKDRPPAMLPCQISRDEAPFLYNLLCDNARPWNKDLRRRVGMFVSDTQAYNAKRELQGRID